MSTPVAVYVHTPFCPSKCGYCDFNSYALSGDIMRRTTAATVCEIRQSPHRGRPAKTIFFGGGTPTYLPVDQLRAILAAVLESHPPIGEIEITSEANPGTVDAEKFAAMREMGFNRISLGAQSFFDDDLLRLGRVHASGEIERAVVAARAAGFANLNVDLMFALPGQSVRAWRENLRRAIDLGTDHLSLYCLTLEPGTPFHKLHQQGRLVVPDDEAQVAMYDVAVETAEQAGLAYYEISNFARPGYECAHNLAYWRGEEYVGYGPGAVGAAALPGQPRIRTTNWKHPEGYVERVEQGLSLPCESEILEDEILAIERVMLGIRLREGLEIDKSMPEDRILSLQKRGWIRVCKGRLSLTPTGRHFATEVALELIPVRSSVN